jgi:phage FluMu protein gp41
MFRSLVRDLNAQNSGALDTFIWYLERHIEVDGDDHGPLSLKMVADICGDDPERWEEAADAAEAALTARLALWDSIAAAIS